MKRIDLIAQNGNDGLHYVSKKQKIQYRRSSYRSV